MPTEKLTQEPLLRWLWEERRVAVATLVEVLGSPPVDLGATMGGSRRASIDRGGPCAIIGASADAVRRRE